MARFGRYGKFPLRFGGEPSPQRKAFDALRSLEGTGLYPPDDLLGDQTIDGAWHQAIASGLGLVSTIGEAAIWQAFPNTVSDLLPEYERILNVAPPLNASDETRRQLIVPKWLGDIKSDYPDLAAALTQLDARFTLEAPNHTLARTSDFGKVIDEQAGPGTFRGGSTSQYPNYSDDFIMNVLLDVGEGVPATGTVGAAKASGEQLLADSIPAWCDYNVILDVGFTLDISLLDVTGMT